LNFKKFVTHVFQQQLTGIGILATSEQLIYRYAFSGVSKFHI